YHVNRRKLRLHHLLLLLLRMLLILLLCSALARPRLRPGSLPLFDPDSESVAAVLLFDTSMSMEYERGGLTRLAEAHNRALERLDALPRGTKLKIAVLDSAEGGGDFLDNRADIEERIKKLEPRPAGGPVTRQFDRAYGLLEELARESEGLSEPPPRYLFVF